MPKQIQQRPDSTSEPTSRDYTQRMLNLNSDDSPVVEHDVELPIALMKGVTPCAHHPICKFIFLEKLSPAYRVFVSRLGQVQIPSTIKVALQDPN